MLNGSNFPKYDSDPHEELACTHFVNDFSNNIKPQWFSRISTNRDAVCLLTHSIKELEVKVSPSIEMGNQMGMINSLKLQAIDFFNKIQTFPAEAHGTSYDSFHTEKFDCIPMLRERKLDRLVSLFEENCGYPWDQIRCISDPILVEQIIEIYLLCAEVKFPEEGESTEKIVNFALNIAGLATNSCQDELYCDKLIRNGQELLGQFIYLIDNKPANALRCIENNRQSQAIRNIKNEFSESVKHICERLQSHLTDHLKAPLQSPLSALYTRIPYEIANALLTARGSINAGIIDLLINIFISSEKNINHEIPLNYALKLLRDNSEFRKAINEIEGPKSTQLPINDVIRASLDLDPNAQVSQTHAKTLALVAVMSGLWQDGEASCFASSLVRELLSSHLIYSLKDLKQLLKDSRLSRKNNGVRKEISFVKKIYDDNINSKIYLDNNGSFLVKGNRLVNLAEAPGIQFACRAIGLVDFKAAVCTVAGNLPFDNHPFIQISVKQFIKKLCMYAIETKATTKPLYDVVEQAYFAFSSQTSQPLLKVWTNVIANMAETEESGIVKRAIIKSICQTFENHLKSLRVLPTAIIVNFFTSLRKYLHSTIELQYDPALDRTESSSHAKGGGFVLFYKDVQVTDSVAFCNFIRVVLEKVQNKLASKKPNESAELTGILSLLKQFALSTEFKNEVVMRFHSGNYRKYKTYPINTPIPYDQLDFTPWKSLLGNDSKEVFKNYLECEQPLLTQELIATRCIDYLSFIIDKCKNFSDLEKQNLHTNPHKLIPMCIPGKHRLSFLPGHSSLQSAWNNPSESTTVWIEKNVLEPGNKISQEVLSNTTKKLLNGELITKILPIFFSSDIGKSICHKLNGSKKQFSIKDYRSFVLETCAEKAANLKRTWNKKKLAAMLDTALYELLNPEVKSQLEKTAVHIADTNWVCGTRNIHFCFVVNPGTGQLELWEANSDGTQLTAIDQDYWLIDQKWEFYIIPDELLKQDT